MPSPNSTFDRQTPVFDILATLPESHELKLKIGEKIKAFMSARRGEGSNIPLPCPGLVSRILNSRSTDPDAWKPGTFNDSAGPKLMADIAFETVCETVRPSAGGAQPSQSGDLIERLNRAVAGVPAGPPDAKASGPAFIRRIAVAVGKGEDEVTQIERQYSALANEAQRAAFASALVTGTRPVATPAPQAATPQPVQPAGPKQSAVQLITRLNLAMGTATPTKLIEKLNAAMGKADPKPVATPSGPLTLNRMQFDALDHKARNEHFRSGGKLID